MGREIRSDQVSHQRPTIGPIISFSDLLTASSKPLLITTTICKRAEERLYRLVDHDDSLHFFPFVAGKRSRCFHFAFCSRKRPSFCRSKRVFSLHEDYRRVWCIWFDRQRVCIPGTQGGGQCCRIHTVSFQGYIAYLLLVRQERIDLT